MKSTPKLSYCSSCNFICTNCYFCPRCNSDLEDFITPITRETVVNQSLKLQAIEEFHRNSFDCALKILDDVLHERPSDSEALYWKYKILIKQNKIIDADKFFDRGLFFPLWLTRVVLYDIGAVIQDAEDATNPGEKAAYYYNGLKELIKTRKDNTLLFLCAEMLRYAIHNSFVEGPRRLMDEILEICEKLENKNRHIGAVLILKSQIYRDLSKIDSSKKHMDLAQECLTKACEYDDNSARALREYGLLLSEQGLYEQAIDVNNRAIALDSTFGPIFNSNASALIKLGKMKQAMEICRQGLSWEPNAPKGWQIISDLVAENQQSLDISLICLERSLVNRGYLMDDNWQRLANLLNRIKEISPNTNKHRWMIPNNHVSEFCVGGDVVFHRLGPPDPIIVTPDIVKFSDGLTFSPRTLPAGAHYYITTGGESLVIPTPCDSYFSFGDTGTTIRSLQSQIEFTKIVVSGLNWTFELKCNACKNSWAEDYDPELLDRPIRPQCPKCHKIGFIKIPSEF